MNPSSLADSTRCVHAGEERHGTNRGLTTDIVQSSVFVMPDMAELRRYAEGSSNAFLYTRYANPTTAAAEQKIAALEGAEGCAVMASGMAAIAATVLAVCETGDEIVSMLDLYGGTMKLFQTVLPRYRVRARMVPFGELHEVEKHITPATRMLFIETPTNPTLRCADIEALAAIGRGHNLCVVVDSTFATPVLQKPLRLGADLVIHSATKYLGGHNDVTAGAVAGARKWIDPIREMMKYTGGCLDPAASYLLIRGLKTLALRVERACANAARIAEALAAHPKVARVLYPGLPSHPAHEIARRQMSDFGMMVSFDIKGDIRGDIKAAIKGGINASGAAAEKFIDSLELWYLATSLGGVESSVSYPLLSSHVGLTDKQLAQLDVSAATVRLSVGIEDAADLIADLDQALRRA